MSSYAQWRAAVDRGDLRRVTWVCGEVRILVEEVVDTIRDLIAPGPGDYVSLNPTEHSEADIWAAVDQHPLTGEARLVLIRDADRLRTFGPLESFVRDPTALRGTHLLFVSAEPDFPHTTVAGRKVLAPHLRLLLERRRLAQAVRCAPPGPADALAWVTRRSHLRDERVATYLLTRTGGNLTTVAGVCTKLAAFDGHAGRATIDLLCAEASADDFVESLVLLRKRAALAAAPALAESDYGRVFAQLDSRLDLLAVLCRAARAGYTLREITGVPQFLARRYLRVAQHYPDRRCAHDRALLAVVDDAMRTGARIGLLEALTALW